MIVFVIIAVLITVIVIGILKDTNISTYSNYSGRNEKTEPLKFPIWGWIIIILLSVFPVFNLIGFVIFICVYSHYLSDIDYNYMFDKYTKLSLRGDNVVSRICSSVVKLLTKKVWDSKYST